jgi:hypothetical protein
MNFRLASIKSLTNCEIPSSNTLLGVYPEQLGILKGQCYEKNNYFVGPKIRNGTF